MKRNRIDIITLGCSKNLVDSEKLARQFVANGYTVKHDAEKVEGEIVVINTCGFVNDAKEESVNTILQFAAAKRWNKIKRLFVMGCLSERYLNELKQEIPEVDKFFGKFDWRGLLSALGKSYHADLELERGLSTPAHLAYLKISEGCSRTCAFCAIPLMTGKHVSRPIAEIVGETKKLVANGVKEILLIAQDLTFYGFDTDRKSRLAELIEYLSDINGLEWIRLHYAYPSLFPYNILKVMQERENVCKYLDIAFQHVSDNMLRLMKRNITKAETLELIHAIRTAVPGIHLRTTLMVGHPGETQADFEELKDFVAEMRFERLGAFVYSDEEGTYANTHYRDDVAAETKKSRLDELMALQETVAFEIARQKTGKTFKTIIDREEPDFYIGRTEFDSPEVDPEVLIEKTKKMTVGDFYQVKISGMNGFDMLGEF
ncbi:MAG: 30S ribosomal protein S12 methylthiotransferase RimO [Bacteroidales bacterium]|nr:30S ribosomal protein S12 methylthiotransferase RimO [Bacteroidales bacterium]